MISVNRYTLPDPVFPLALPHLGAALRAAGYEYAYWDALASPEPLATTLKANTPDFIGISIRNIDDILVGERECLVRELPILCEEIRRCTRAPIILGGSGFSIFPRELLQAAGAEFGICGEGESSLVSLLRALEERQSWREIPGLVYRDEAGIRINPRQPASPVPAQGRTDWPSPLVEYYLKASHMLNVQTQRGCAFRCCYCTYPLIEGRQHRERDPEEVAAEFEQAARLGATYLFVVDSVFNSSVRHVTALCEALLRRNLRVRWSCFLRPAGLNVELMRLMKRAGLAHADFGTDSLCDSVLEQYGKSFTIEDVLAASEAARMAGVDFCHYLICGGPAETEETLEVTYRNSLRMASGIFMAVIGMRIYPGTPLFERAVSDGQIRPDANLLEPAYYIAPGLIVDRILERLRRYAEGSPQWIAGEVSPAYAALSKKLRSRGVAGPIWSYLPALQRLSPRTSDGSPGRPGAAPAPAGH